MDAIGWTGTKAIVRKIKMGNAVHMEANSNSLE